MVSAPPNLIHKTEKLAIRRTVLAVVSVVVVAVPSTAAGSRIAVIMIITNKPKYDTVAAMAQIS